MPKISLIKSKEQLDEDEAKRLRAINAEVQEEEMRQRQKLQALVNKKRRNKAIIISTFTILSIALLVFGMKNTFFTQQVTTADIQNVVYQSITTFPISGLDGFLKNNVEELFDTYKVLDNNSNYDSVSDSNTSTNNTTSVFLDITSLAIDEVKQQSNTLAFVWFSVDVISESKVNTNTNTNVTTENTTAETDPAISTTEAVNSMKKNRYQFFLPVEYYTNRLPSENEEQLGTVIGYGYRPAGDLEINNLAQNNSATVTYFPTLGFTEENGPLDPSSTDYITVKAKVEKILKDLYAGENTEKDYISRKVFDSNGFTFVAISEFKYYKIPNATGYNAYVKYIIQNKDGLLYYNNSYLSIIPNGTSYAIDGIL